MVMDQVMASHRDATGCAGTVVIDAAAGLGKTTIATSTLARSTALSTASSARRLGRGINVCRWRSFAVVRSR